MTMITRLFACAAFALTLSVAYPVHARGVEVTKDSSIICADLDDLKIVQAWFAGLGSPDKFPPVQSCWRIDAGEQLVELNAIGEFARVAQDQGNIQRGWTLRSWLKPLR